MKSYNTRALRGENYNDVEFQRDMRGSNVNIPDSLLFKPEMNKFVLGEILKKTIHDMSNDIKPGTGKPYSMEESVKEANRLHEQAAERIERLVQRST